MDRYWLLTSTTYGTWLPGDERGFVSNLFDRTKPAMRHNVPETPYDMDLPELRELARKNLKCPPVHFAKDHADVLFAQFQETAEYRGWLLCAVAIMTTHFHIVVGVPGDPDPDTILRDFKSYGSRALNRRWETPASGTWWTEGGSKRKLKGEANVIAAIRYVAKQEYPLIVWIAAEFRHLLDGERGA